MDQNGLYILFNSREKDSCSRLLLDSPYKRRFHKGAKIQEYRKVRDI